MWEKKTQLAKETAAAIDPNVGAAETKALSKEIERLSTHLNALKRKQQTIILELERAVGRRESVLVRYTRCRDLKLKLCRGAKEVERNTSVAKNIVQKKTNELSKRVKLYQQELSQTKRTIQSLKETREQMMAELQDYDSKLTQKKRQLEDMKSLCNSLTGKRHEQFDMITTLQKLMKKYELVERLDASALESKGAVIGKELKRQEEKHRKIGEVLNNLESEYSFISANIKELKQRERQLNVSL